MPHHDFPDLPAFFERRPKTGSTRWRDVLPVHPATKLFPLMSRDELLALGEDIKANGLSIPVVVWGSPPCLLDGRNRLDALEMMVGDASVSMMPDTTEQPSGHVPGFAPPFEWVARIVAQAREAGCRVYLKPNLNGETSPQRMGMALLQEEPETPVTAAEAPIATDLAPADLDEGADGISAFLRRTAGGAP